MRRSRRDPYGCHSDTDEPLQKSWPGRFDGIPGGDLHRCPNRVLRDMPALVMTVLHLVRDYRAGVIRPGWREYYAAHVVEAVDYAVTESDAASADAMDRR